MAKTFEKLNEYLDARYCRLSNEDEEMFKNKINEVFEVKSFFGYYKVIDHDIPDKDTLNKMLRQAIKNSLAKKYHGIERKFTETVKLDEQAQNLLFSKPTMLKYWDEKTQQLDKKDDDEFWKQLCCERFKWIKDKLDYDFNQWKPKDFAFRSDYVKMYGTSKNDDSMIKYNQSNFIDPIFRQIEDYTTYFEYSRGYDMARAVYQIRF